MDTREKLNGEMKRTWAGKGPILALGLVLGFILGFGGNAVGSASLSPQWAYTILAFGLGGACTIAYWWLTGYQIVRKPKESV